MIYPRSVAELFLVPLSFNFKLSTVPLYVMSIITSEKKISFTEICKSTSIITHYFHLLFCFQRQFVLEVKISILDFTKISELWSKCNQINFNKGKVENTHTHIYLFLCLCVSVCVCVVVFHGH